MASSTKGESEKMSAYFAHMDIMIKKAYDIAEAAKKQSFDPMDKVEVPAVSNMAERVEGLISVVAPNIIGSGISERIKELEEKYSALDWRISLIIAEEIAKEKYCKFKDKLEAMDIGIRVGFAYHTMGSVASPIEGFVEFRLEKTNDGKEYFDLYYAGPIRSAGGTGASVSVLIADYVRMKMGYAPYDPTEQEIKRASTELYDYHDRITNLQYLPSEEEIEFMVKNLPVQINGDGSEKIEVSNHKDLPRVATNKIRNGVCLVIGEGLCQKAPKLWKQLSKWGKEFGLDHWNFIEDFVKLQKKIKAGKSSGGDEKIPEKEEKKSKLKIQPDYTFIKDLVAGRPVITHPLREGGFRLRYGRSRTSGYSAASMHPATMAVLDNFVATGTQLKLERPGKAASMTCCDYMEGPIVKLKDGSVVKLDDENEAQALRPQIEEIIFLGDILLCFGDFINRAHKLVPPGYCEEWWVQQFEKAIVDNLGSLDTLKLSEMIGISKENIESILSNPIKRKPSVAGARIISEKLNIPLHPEYIYYWSTIDRDSFINMVKWLKQAKKSCENDKIIKIILPNNENKRILELLGVPHILVNNEFVIIEKENAVAFALNIDMDNLDKYLAASEDKNISNVLDIIQKESKLFIEDKAGVFIGARMGRPEKAKMRKLQGTPHTLFPIGEEGGRLRSFQAALEAKAVNSDFPIYRCKTCSRDTIYRRCEICSELTQSMYYCRECNKVLDEPCDKPSQIYEGEKHKSTIYKRQKIDIKTLFNQSLKNINMKLYPDLIKGVRGTSNKEHIPENLVKGILRAKHDVFVNKDGTTRYDMTQLPLTHFKPIEVRTTIEKLKELGYDLDIHGNPLENENQILEIKPQDVILPACPDSPNEGADLMLFNVANYIDDLLVSFYKLKPYYNLKNKEDIVGHLILAQAPHTSAGIVTRVVGFSKTQGFYAHPMIHAATRRDCLTYDNYISLYDKKNNKWSNVKIGEFIENLNPDKIVDSQGTLVKEVNEFFMFAYNKNNNLMELVPIKEFSKHKKSPIIEFILESGNSIKTTLNHQIYTKGFIKKRASTLEIGEQLIVPYSIDLNENDTSELNLFEIFNDKKNLMGRGNLNEVLHFVKSSGGRKKARKLLNLSKNDMDNFLLRDSFPIKLLFKLKIIPKKLGYKRCSISIPSIIQFNEDVLYLIGLYIAEGFARKNSSKKGFFQISIAATEKEIRDNIKRIMKSYFGLNPSENHDDHLTYSSRIIYELFVKHLKLGSNAREKCIPSIFLNLPKHKLAYLLSGYYDGDGSVSKGDLRVMCDTISKKLIFDLSFALKRFGIFTNSYEYEKELGQIVKDFYIKKKRDIPKFKVTKITISSKFSKLFLKHIGFRLSRKQKILINNFEKIKPKFNKIESDKSYAYPKIIKIKEHKEETTYCLNLKHHNFMANNLLVKNCDGDEASICLLLDVLVNFSRHFLPAHRGSTQDAPLVLTSKVVPSEIDDMIFDMDIAWKYDLDFYNACKEYKNPWDVAVDKFGDFLQKERQYEGHGFTHDITNINHGTLCSAYKILPSMAEKLGGQMAIAKKVRAVDESDVATFVIEKHFIKDTKGNLRKFSMQQFRCIKCNEIYRRPPLIGKCEKYKNGIKCNGRIIFTISEGSVVKYFESSMDLATTYNVSPYLKQTLEVLGRRIEGVFGKDKERQEALGKWFG